MCRFRKRGASAGDNCRRNPNRCGTDGPVHRALSGHSDRAAPPAAYLTSSSLPFVFSNARQTGNVRQEVGDSEHGICLVSVYSEWDTGGDSDNNRQAEMAVLV